MFSSRSCATRLNPLENNGSSSYQYALTTIVPPFSTTGAALTRVPLRIQLHDESGVEKGLLDVGPFQYTDSQGQQSQASPQEFSRKRKISMDSAESMKGPAKRTSSQQLQPSPLEDYTSQPYGQGEITSYPQLSQPGNQSSIRSSIGPYSRPQSRQDGLEERVSSRRSSHNYSSNPVPQSLLRGLAPQTQSPSWRSSIGGVNQASRNQGISTPSGSRLSSLSSASGSVNPPLIRTSTLTQTPSPAATPAATSNTTFNPYAMYPHKAVLKIHGDLDSMSEGWTDQEWQVRRRIIQFWRSQNGNTIDTEFEAVPQENRPPNSICISCIWWEEKKECYVTSVDTIYLLESLVSVRFTVEEKNRIRRNLEGFRPLTVSKAKADSEEFFKIIMSFPNPKPRNIEKDVKVFPWKILAHALKKIIGKYVRAPHDLGSVRTDIFQSASYSSTAGTLPTPRSSIYSLASSTDAEHHPASRSGSFTSTAPASYVQGRASTSVSPHLSQPRLSLPSTISESPLQVSMPPQAYTVPTLHSQYSSHDPSDTSSLLPTQAAAAQPGRSSWDFASYLDANPASPRTTHPSLQYSHTDHTQAPTSKPQ